MKFLLIFFFIIPTLLYSEAPWGIDADIRVPIEPPCECREKTSLLAQFGQKAIKFHQDVISPADGPRSHFIPSSSQYTLEAMKKYGFCQGFLMGCDRLMRENNEDWVYQKIKHPNGRNVIKWDPVP